MSKSNQTETTTAEQLRERLAALKRPDGLKVGSIVRFKQGLKNKRSDVGIVVELFDEPILDESPGAGSPYFREPLDMVIGTLDGDGDLLAYHVDSRRYEIVE